MQGRREFFQAALGLMAGAVMAGPALAMEPGGRRARVPSTARLTDLIGRNPATLDASALPVTNIEHFGTMGLSDYKADLAKWRVKLLGKVERPMELTYEQVLARPRMEAKALVICPGFFAYQGLWAGFSLWELLQEAGMRPDAAQVLISGPSGVAGKTERFGLDEVRAGRVWLAHHVNGKPLPVRHGRPLRVVAPDHYGDDWVKYLDRIEVA